MKVRLRHPVIVVLIVLAILSVLDHAGVFGYQKPDHERYHGRFFTIEAVRPDAILELRSPDGDDTSTPIRLKGLVPGDPSTMAGFLERHVGERVRIGLDPSGPTRDDSGFLLAYLFLERDGAMLNAAVLQAGLATADRLPHPFQLRFTLIEAGGGPHRTARND